MLSRRDRRRALSLVLLLAAALCSNFGVQELADGAPVCRCFAGRAGNTCERVADCLCEPSAVPPVGQEIFCARVSCPAALHEERVRADLGIWREGNISRALVDEAEQYATARFVIHGGRLFVRSKAPRQANLVSLTNLLLVLLRHVEVPDVDFAVGLADRPQITKHDPIPLFGVVKTEAHNDVLLPDGFFLSSEWLGWGTMRQRERRPWSEKDRRRLFWRGTTTGRWKADPYTLEDYRFFPRPRLVRLSRDRPDLVDARFSTSYPMSAPIAAVNRAPFMALRDQMRDYAFLATVDGNGCSGRFAAFLASDGVPFKQTSPFYEFYYPFVRAWEHFVPLRYDLADVEERVAWARQHEAEARAIADAGARVRPPRLPPHPRPRPAGEPGAGQFAGEQLQPQHVLAYAARPAPRPSHARALVDHAGLAGCPCVPRAEAALVRLVHVDGRGSGGRRAARATPPPPCSPRAPVRAPPPPLPPPQVPPGRGAGRGQGGAGAGPPWNPAAPLQLLPALAPAAEAALAPQGRAGEEVTLAGRGRGRCGAAWCGTRTGGSSWRPSPPTASRPRQLLPPGPGARLPRRLPSRCPLRLAVRPFGRRLPGGGGGGRGARLRAPRALAVIALRVERPLAAWGAGPANVSCAAGPTERAACARATFFLEPQGAPP
eukprot:tig00021721_g23227.t1